MAHQLTIKAPFDGKEIATLPLHSLDEVKKMLSGAHALSRRPKARISVPHRLEILAKTQEIIRHNDEKFLLMAAQEGESLMLTPGWRSTEPCREFR